VDHEPKAVRVQSPFGRPREPSILVAVIAAFLLIALLKPWSFGEDGSDSGRPGARDAIPSGSGLATGGEPSLAATPSIPDPNAMACMTDATEQVVIIERWAGHEVRSWVAAADMTASGPLDERLVPLSIFSSHVIALGICASRAQIGITRQPAARLLAVESIVQTVSGPLVVDLGKPDPITLQLSGLEPAVLFGAPVVTLPRASVGPPRFDPPAGATATEPPPETPTSGTGLPSPTDGRATWPTGSYAIAFRFPLDRSNIVRWLRIDIIQGAGATG
jgi:hypothetical protein